MVIRFVTERFKWALKTYLFSTAQHQWDCFRDSGTRYKYFDLLTYLWAQWLKERRVMLSIQVYTPVRNVVPLFLFHLYCHWQQNPMTYISVNRSLKIDISAHSFSEPFIENRILHLHFQWRHSLKIDLRNQNFSEPFTENRSYANTVVSEWTFNGNLAIREKWTNLVRRNILPPAQLKIARVTE